jgi:hypothetical protein
MFSTSSYRLSQLWLQTKSPKKTIGTSFLLATLYIVKDVGLHHVMGQL